MLAWGASVGPTFRARVVAISARIGFDPSWLMACMAFETGRTFDPAKRNSSSSATGLIQFMRATAIGLGTTVEALANMSDVEQLDYVEKYFLPYAGRLHTLSDVYMAILWPKAIGVPDSAVIFPAGSQEYLANRGLDVDHDGAVTKGEAAAFVARALAEGMGPVHVADETRTPTRAPIEDRSTEYQPATDRIINPEQESPMPSILDALGPIATAINPIAGILLSAFTPFLKDKITKEVDRHADTPGIGEQVSNLLIDAAIKATGKTDPLEAVAVARQDPVIMAKVEVSATEWLAQMAPLLDKLAAMEQARWAANDDSADKAAARGQKDKVDIAPVLVSQSAWAFSLAAFAILVLLAVQVYFDSDHRPDPTLMGFMGILVYGVVRMMDRPSAYRFGGAFESDGTASTRAVVNESIRQQQKGQS